MVSCPFRLLSSPEDIVIATVTGEKATLCAFIMTSIRHDHIRMVTRKNNPGKNIPGILDPEKKNLEKITP